MRDTVHMRLTCKIFLGIFSRKSKIVRKYFARCYPSRTRTKYGHVQAMISDHYNMNQLEWVKSINILYLDLDR